jgi:hypothetical protein
MAATSSQAGTRALILMFLLAALPQVAAADPGGKRHGRTYYTLTDLGTRGFLYSGGRMQQLSEFGIAIAINNRGEVTGSDTNTNRVLLYAGDQTVSLGNLGGAGQAIGNAINERGEIVGASSTPKEIYMRSIIVRGRWRI